MNNPKHFWMSIRNLECIVKTISEARKTRPNYRSSFIKNKLHENFTEHENLSIFIKTLNNSEIEKLMIEIFMDMYKYDFAGISSVKNKYSNLPQEGLENVKKSNLLNHTFGVINNMNEMISKSYGTATDFFILVAMVHDYGKSLNLIQGEVLAEYDKDGQKKYHHKISSEYLSNKIIGKKFNKSTNKLLKATINAINLHHDQLNTTNIKADEEKEVSEAEAFSSILLDALKKADIKQREYEEEYYSSYDEEEVLEDKDDI